MVNIAAKRVNEIEATFRRIKHTLKGNIEGNVAELDKEIDTLAIKVYKDANIDINEEARSGTLITFEEDEKMEKALVSGIAFSRDEAKISVLGVPDKPGKIGRAHV